MLIVYASKTGNVERFINKLPYTNTLKIITGTENINENAVLVTYTTGIGEVPENVNVFCQNNHTFIQAIVASGNRNWGNSYGISADILAEKYQLPIMMKFELSGRPDDVNKFIKGVDDIEKLLRIKQ